MSPRSSSVSPSVGARRSRPRRARSRTASAEMPSSPASSSYERSCFRTSWTTARWSGARASRLTEAERSGCHGYAQPVHDEPIPGFDGLYGLELQSVDGDEVRARVHVDDRHLQPFGLVHGGGYAAMAESIASHGTAIGTGQQKFVAGLSNQTSFLRPVFKDDTISAVATPRHKGSTTWVWEVECTDGQGRPCALVRV